MSPTTGFQAGLATNDSILSYAPEVTWGTNPATQLKQVRVQSESLSQSKGRGRPNEINPSGQVSAAVTQKVETKGDMKFALSTATPFDVLCASIMSTPQVAVVFAAKTTIAATASGFTDSANGFTAGAGFLPGTWIKVAGFTTTGAASNITYQILTVAVGTITTMPAPPAAKVAGDSITITGQTAFNGNIFQSFWFQQQLAAAVFLTYPGSWPVGGSISASVGGFFSGSISFLSKDQVKSITDTSTGAQIAAGTGDVINTVSGFGTIYRNGIAMTAKVQKIDLKWTLQSASQQFAMGSSAAVGMRKGLLEATGSIDLYFADFSQYDEFIAETKSMVAFQAFDSLGQGFIFCLSNAALMDPKIDAGGPNQDVIASFTLEGNPSATGSIYGGSTLSITKI